MNITSPIFSKWFSEKASLPTVVNVTATRQPVYSDAVKEIHREFNTASEQGLSLLRNKMKTTKEELERVILKSTQLNSVGFVNQPTVVTSHGLKEKLKEVTRDIKLREYYSQEYPWNKFISEQDVIQLCEKYNLYLGWIYDFVGDVPGSNLNEIVSFNARKHKNAIKWNTGKHMTCGSYPVLEKNAKKYLDSLNNTPTDEPFKVAAPLSMFDMTNKTINNRSIVPRPVPPDPIVLKMVEGGFLIVTAWGPEASDDLVTNPNRN